MDEKFALNLKFRTEPRSGDIEIVKGILESGMFFSQEEVLIAVELVEERLRLGEKSGYYFLFAEAQDNTLGYSCYGPIPAACQSYDLYWIAIHQSFKRQGIGRLLLEHTERAILRFGGRRIFVETSGRSQYAPTRGFYESNGYEQAATLQDFYREGDDKIIYRKALDRFSLDRF